MIHFLYSVYRQGLQVNDWANIAQTAGIQNPLLWHYFFLRDKSMETAKTKTNKQQQLWDARKPLTFIPFNFFWVEKQQLHVRQETPVPCVPSWLTVVSGFHFRDPMLFFLVYLRLHVFPYHPAFQADLTQISKFSQSQHNGTQGFVILETLYCFENVVWRKLCTCQ